MRRRLSIAVRQCPLPPPLTRPNRVPTAGLSALVRVAAHLATKLAALVDRPDSAPGDKDRHEIMALLGQNVAHVGHQQQFGARDQ